MFLKLTYVITVYIILVTTQVLLLEARSFNGGDSSRCRNPNGRLGFCISVHNCESFRYVLRNRLENCYNFLRASQCDDDNTMTFGNSPFVCCTSDINFVVNDNKHAIRFPVDNRKLIAVPLPVQTTEATDKDSSTSREHKSIVTFPIESMPKQQIYIAEIVEPNMLQYQSQVEKFPKHPKCGSVTISNKIYGGLEAELTEFSWMVNLEYRKNGSLTSVCSGSIINDRYILTAAHCVVGNIEKMVGQIESVILGDHNTVTEIDCKDNKCTGPVERVGIESIKVHEDYRDDKLLKINQHNDIALIRLNRKINFTEAIQPVCLPFQTSSDTLRSGTMLTAAGWGHTGSAKSSKVKLKVRLPFVEKRKCRDIFSKVIYVADEQMCAGGIFREDTCTGDSGGPLMRIIDGFWFVEGIVSFGRGCGKEQPGIYTRVRNYLEWIEQNVI